MSEPAERKGSAHAGAPLAEAATCLRWLSPGAASLAALARPVSSATWRQVRSDPGAVLLLLRQPNILPTASSPFPGPSLQDSKLLEEAVRQLDPPADGFVDWSRPAVAPIYQAALACARMAHRLAVEIGRCDPERAWVCGLLAPLGWLAISAISPDAPGECLHDPDWAGDPSSTQCRRWGLDQGEIARRLARYWRLPGWIVAVAGHLGLPTNLARIFGADPLLFSLTRLAVYLMGTQGHDLGLVNADFVVGDCAALGLHTSSAEAMVPADDSSGVPVSWEDPYTVPLLRDFLGTAAENRRLRDARLHQQLERECDDLHRALETQVTSETQRLETAKLTALAEFAAGAGHEINNPLAVISGQAQYLLSHAAEWFAGDTADGARKALKAVVAQTRRIHSILRDLMLFARPAQPCPEWIDLPALLGQVAAGLGDLAAQRGVQVEVRAGRERLLVLVDAEQVRLALGCLLRNAIEAALTEGWARLVLVEPVGPERAEVAIEDSGPGPDPEVRAALFDPFYSGRSAGRGRGLGLPIAWRLARQQGGDLRLDPARLREPTRFVLTLPRMAAPAGAGGGVAKISPGESELPALLPAAPLAAGSPNGCSHS